MQMIILTSLIGKATEYFEDYSDLFEYLTELENAKLIAQNLNFQTMNWSFIIHSPRRVAAFYGHLKDTCEAINEAYEEGLSLIEICAGDYTKPTYIALTPNVDLGYLKQKWCVDYCTWHHLVVREV
jgi:hypothetical protein